MAQTNIANSSRTIRLISIARLPEMEPVLRVWLKHFTDSVPPSADRTAACEKLSSFLIKIQEPPSSSLLEDVDGAQPVKVSNAKQRRRFGPTCFRDT